ncbi:protein TolR [Ferrovibrio terrae]|jgi:biopolymer transport protein TolR|uniref:Protein TolR n=1 Tax=Ferrovibrio terrae TaxID=2594003 RepID=A0A516GXR0_9PROT|nr:protein TolR [Ferrovibrio terrae]QDO96120.1 protein TolR [Ferrovibrio terrae]
MGMSTGGGSTRGGRMRRAPMSEINVTPLVDVMLVLLIVFMVAAPLLTVGVQVDLPKTQAAAIQGQDEPLSVTIDAKGVVYLQESPIEVDQLVARLQAIAGNASERRIFVRGDQAINYGKVLEVMGVINTGGFTKVALVGNPPNAAPRR